VTRENVFFSKYPYPKMLNINNNDFKLDDKYSKKRVSHKHAVTPNRELHRIAFKKTYFNMKCQHGECTSTG